ncbi:MAG: glycoside hydrolase family 2 TIM barrel-domain containing protein [Ruminococcus sp.]
MIAMYDLSGVWDLSLAQMQSGCCAAAFDDTIALPGTTSLAKKGTPNPVCETGYLTDAYAFEGQAWFRKKLYIQPEHVGKPMHLTLERTRLTQLWINGAYAGSQDSLCTPHVYDITDYVKQPLVEIVICVKNTDYPTKGGHLTSPDTQSNWNGITGEIKLEVLDPVYVDDVQAYPHPETKSVTLKMQLHGAQHAHLIAEGTVLEDEEHDCIPVFSQEIAADENGQVMVEIPLGDTIYLWSEYTPALYHLWLRINEKEVTTICFGLRTMKADQHQFTINEQPTMLRGKHDGLIFPLTGYAPTDVNEWIRILSIAKDYGINHYRFHTCCPPDAAFTAADILGIYMEPELPFWGTITTEADENHNAAEQQYLVELGYKILKTFGNHPSFTMFSLGNELWGSSERMAEILRGYHAADNRHLYTQGCNNFQFYPQILPEDDFFVGVRLSKERLIRGSYAMCDAPLGHVQTERPGTSHCYDPIIFPTASEKGEGDAVQEIEIQYGTGVKKVQVSSNTEGLIPNKPVVTHEIGQFAVYPDFKEIQKYTGALQARNFEIFRTRLEEKGMLSQAEDFFRCSGMLSAACYKEELEAAMRSQYIAGFQILDLQDFSGQGTALVGMLDAFMDNKGLISPEEWRMFCSDAVILAKFPCYVLTAGETFTADLALRRYGMDHLSGAAASWLLLCDDGTELGSGSLEIPQENIGLTELGTIIVELPEVQHAQQLHLILSVSDTEICNAYDLYLYPRQEAPVLASRQGLTVTTNYTEAITALEAGGKVLYLPNTVKEAIQGFYCTDFWCYPMFRSISEWMKKPVPVGTMGLCIQEAHPALTGFLSEQYSTPQWYDIVSHADCAILDDMPSGYRPIVQMIDNFERNYRLGILFEAKVGAGSLLVCTSRLNEIMMRAEVRQFAAGILSYAASEDFSPETEMSKAQLDQLFVE